MSEPVSQTLPGWFDFARLLVVLRKRQATVLLFLAAVLAAAAAASLLVERRFTAVALVHLMPRAGQEVDVDEVVQLDAPNWFESKERARTQMQIIQSRSVREEVLARYAALGHTDLGAGQEGAAALREMLSVRPREDTQLVEIAVTHTDPERAALLANLVAEVYRQGNLEARTGAARDSKVWLDGRASEYQAALEETSRAILDFKAENDVVDIEEKIDAVTARLNALHEAMGTATADRVLQETTLAEHERLLAQGKLDVLAGMYQDPALDALSREYASVLTGAAEVTARYGDQHPEHKRAVAHVARVEDLMHAEVRRNLEAEKSKVATLRRQEDRLAAELAEVKEQLLDKQRLQARYDELKLEQDRARRTFEALGDREAEVDLQARTELNDVRIVDPAVPPSAPSVPDVPLNLAVALVVGLGGGIGLALVRERIDDTVSGADDVAMYLREPLLGSIPGIASAEGRANCPLFLAEHPQSPPAEALRGIRTFLLNLLDRRASRRVLVASAAEGEGKTCTVAGLGVAYAQLGARVLLVDGNLRSPRLHEAFDLPRSPGLLEVAGGSVPAAEAVRPTGVPNLSVLAAGAPTAFPTELLASAEVGRALDELGRTFHLVLIDTPAAAVLSDAMGLAGKVDGIVFVVRRGGVRREPVVRAMGRLVQAGGRLLGIVLTDGAAEAGAGREGGAREAAG